MRVLLIPENKKNSENLSTNRKLPKSGKIGEINFFENRVIKNVTKRSRVPSIKPVSKRCQEVFLRLV